jgi:hypothetical protein
MVCKRLVPILALLAGSLIGPGRVWAQTTQLSGIGQVDYRIVHKFHKVAGVSTAMVVRGTVDASGLKVMARAQVSTFDSGNTNRDAHMMEAVEGEKYPWASVRAVLPGFRLPAKPGTAKIKVQAEVELHGIAVSHPIDLDLETKDGVHFHVTFEFTESLTAHKVERPSLLFVAVDDLMTLVGKADITAKN